VEESIHVSTRAQPVPHRVGWPQRRLLWLLVGLVLTAAIAVAVAVALHATESAASRPELQRVLDGLVTGPGRDAPGVTAYVSGPHGTWLGSAGVADVRSGTAMDPHARMRIESNSKTWLAAVILQLAEEGRLTLDDTVARWLPDLLRSHGDRITIRQLMHDTSGLIDDNDVFSAGPAGFDAYVARVGDAGLRAELRETAARVRANPAAFVPALLLVHLAAWQPLVAAPGTTYHHSNIGWNVAGLIAAEAGGKPLAALYRERLFQPLGLLDTAFSPQGPIPGPHAKGYARDGSGRLVDTTAMHPAKFSDGAIVTNARDEATFLHAAMDGTLFPKARWLGLYGSPAGATGCGAPAYAGTGTGDGYRSHVWFDETGERVAVLLLNQNRGDAAAAALRLFCAA
jgi:D-alanyl-D-alanine carboxypeptidase